MSKKSEINKKKVIIVVMAVLVILAIVFGIIFIIKKNNKNNATDTTDTESAEAEATLETFSIKNSSKNVLKKDGIEVESIDFRIIGEELEVKTIIKNNTKEDLNGYMLDIDLLDRKGNVVTSISDNSTDVLKARKTKEILNYVVDLDDPKQIVSAKITSFEKGSAGDTLNQTLDEMTPELEGVQQGPTQ